MASATPETMPGKAFCQEGPPTEQAGVTVLAHHTEEMSLGSWAENRSFGVGRSSFLPYRTLWAHILATTAAVPLGSPSQGTATTGAAPAPPLGRP